MYQNLIAHIRKQVNLTESEIQTLHKFVKPISLKSKEFLLKEGKICKAIYFVEKGCLRMFYINNKAEEQTFQFALENWWMTDFFSFIDQTPSEYNIQAIEKSEILFIDSHTQDKLLCELPQLERYFRIVLQRVSAANQVRLKNIYELSKEEIFHNFNSSFPEFVQRVPQYMLASYLGISAEYVSRLRKKNL